MTSGRWSHGVRFGLTLAFLSSFVLGPSVQAHIVPSERAVCADIHDPVWANTMRIKTPSNVPFLRTGLPRREKIWFRAHYWHQFGENTERLGNSGWFYTFVRPGGRTSHAWYSDGERARWTVYRSIRPHALGHVYTITYTLLWYQRGRLIHRDSVHPVHVGSDVSDACYWLDVSGGFSEGS